MEKELGSEISEDQYDKMVDQLIIRVNIKYDIL